ncbi:MAG: DUF1016 domain-containing protein [Candidatus Margulisiibacteriota bacterium]|nr:MAG: hypothetical protein A2X11_00030 [Bacteroidetes bacterium GWE2_42_24]PZM81930.1 MAG: DUF1016 domain-containing protein [Candidatus Margulisiibacteriota bacterium]HAN21927.1 DUF1016 domain-containing protein [Clostridiales bacterium]HCT84611.1 DUF1016 domain-containing protein [Candidatus Margulisiibacteriota bacterium]
MSNIKPDKSYIDTLSLIKQKIKTAQIKATLSVNAEMLLLYWDIGNTILEQQKKEGWGAKVIDRLAADLQKTFPDMKGFSSRNLKYMRKFANTFPDNIIVQEVLAQITWYHNITLLDKIDSQNEILWYARKTAENGWSRNILVHQLENNLYQRQAMAEKTTNFERTLSAPTSDLAIEIIKDPYKFDFLSLGNDAHEREVEKELIKHISDFLLELGAGFAFIGRQYHLELDEKDYYIDLLFYHTRLHCYVVIELKIGDFLPEYVGKMNFYLSAVDDLLKSQHDNPSIGIILCKTKKKLTAEYALRDTTKPMGIAEYKLTEAIPDDLKTSLPSIEELEKGLENELTE